MRTSEIALGLLIVSLTAGCGDDKDDSNTTSDLSATASQSATATASDDGGSADDTAGDDSPTSSATATATDTAGTDTATADGGSASTTGGPACDPVVPGDWAPCIDQATGNVDTGMCNWKGSGDSVGFPGCLTPGMDDGSSVCMLKPCNDVCDCFAPPTTGNATVVCEAIVDGGEVACGLSCAGAETCPDGMECMGGLCFWPGDGTGTGTSGG